MSTAAAAPTLGGWLRQGPYTLAMSAGFFGFFAHTGVVSALEEADLAPARVTGASAGAMVAGLWAAGLGTAALGERFTGLRREDFWDPRLGLGLLAGRKFRGLLEAMLPVASVGDTRVPCALVVHDILGRRPVAVARGSLAAAIHASAAMPPLFHPVWLDGRLVTDGGASDRAAYTPLAPGERCLAHHLVNRSPLHVRRQHRALPRRDGAVVLAISGLPQLGPFALAEGARVIAAARAATRVALARRIHAGAVEIDAST